MNRLQVAGPNQVNLRVKVAEVSRNVLERIGFSFDGLLLSGNFQLGLATGRTFVDQSRESIERLSDTGFAHLVYETSHGDINAIIDALESEGLVSLLAEPNLTALSGETASFLAGGEFPVPVVDRLGGASVEFKDYGVSLAFTPTVLSGNRINLKVMPEVSSISSAGATTLNGINIPALTTRRASTSVELGSGQSFAIAGLLSGRHGSKRRQVSGTGRFANPWSTVSLDPIRAPRNRTRRHRDALPRATCIVRCLGDAERRYQRNRKWSDASSRSSR